MNESPNSVPEAIKTVAVFDVCDTLYAQNTTFGFIRYLMRGQKIFRYLDAIATQRWSPLFLGFAIISKISGRDHLRNVYLRCLRGKKLQELDLVADAYVAEVLEPLALTWTHAALKEALRQGHTVYLCSASIDCVVNAVARRLRTLSLSSKLEFVDDACTGRMVYDLTGKKKDAIVSLPGLKVGSTRICVFTDNFSDIDLVRLSDEATVILPGGRGREKWVGCNVEFVNA